MLNQNEQLNRSQMAAAQAGHDNRLPSDTSADDALEAEGVRFAEKVTEEDLGSEEFFSMAERFGAETVAAHLEDDDQCYILQLLLKYRDDSLAKPFIARLYADAYGHKVAELMEEDQGQ